MKRIDYQLVPVKVGKDRIDWQLIELFRRRFEILWDNLKDLRLGNFNASISKNSDGTFEVNSTLPKIHRLKGFYTDYRHFYLQNEKTNIFKIMKYLTSLSDSREYHNFIKQEKKKYKSDFIENNWLNIQGKILTTNEVLDLWFNAEIFHNDDNKVKRLNIIRKLMNEDLWKFIVFMAVYDTSLIIRNIHWSQKDLSENNLFVKMPNIFNK